MDVGLRYIKDLFNTISDNDRMTMPYLRIGSSRSHCSCDPRSSVDPTATGHYKNYAPEYHGSNEPCMQPWDYYVTTYGSLVADGTALFEEAQVPYKGAGL